MKKALTNNLGLKILALVFSALLWLIVMNSENPIMSRTYSGIPIEIVHGEVITNKGNTYQVSDETKTVTVEIQAKRSTLNKIRSEDIKAVADMRDLTVNSMIEVKVSVPRYPISSAKATPSNVQVSIDSSSSKTFAITAATSGTLRDGYILGDVKASPEKVEISGPTTQVESIAKVVAEVDVSGLSTDSKLPAELILYDEGGKIIDPTMLKTNLGNEGASVNITLKRTKKVPLNFDTSLLKPAEGYKIGEITVEPQTIQLAGDPDKIAEIESIEIPARVLADNNLSEKIEKNIDLETIKRYLPDEVEAVEDNPGNIVVTINVELLGTRSFEVPLASIYLKNVAEGFKAVYPQNSTGSIAIVVRGPKETLEELKLDKTNVSANLLTYTTEGTYDVPLEVSLPSGCSLALENLSVQITLEKQ